MTPISQTEYDANPGMAFSSITDWVFDLDNTLYPAECNLFAQIDQKITAFVSGYLGVPPEEARKVQKSYYKQYGTTLSGLMAKHGMDPTTYLHYVHEIDLSVLPDLTKLGKIIDTLPGRKFVYTNGSNRHAQHVTEKLGFQGLFDGLFGIEDGDFHPKPAKASYHHFCQRFEVAPDSAIFFEDLSRNLKPAKHMGFSTVLVHSEKDWSHEPEGVRPGNRGDDATSHVDYYTSNLTEFLRDVAAKISA